MHYEIWGLVLVGIAVLPWGATAVRQNVRGWRTLQRVIVTAAARRGVAL